VESIHAPLGFPAADPPHSADGDTVPAPWIMSTCAGANHGGSVRIVRFLLGIAAATCVGLGFASPAHAAELELTDSHQRVLAREFARQTCAEGTPQTDPRMDGRGVHQDGWHLRASGGDLVRLTITFAPDGAAGDDRVVEGAVGDPASPVAFYATGPFVPDAYVFAPAGSLLVTATAEVARGTRLIVQAACAGTPEQPTGPTPSPTATAIATATATPTPSAGTPGPTAAPPAGPPAPAPSRIIQTVSPAPAGSAAPAPAAEDPPPPDEDLPGLAFTGAQVGGMVVLGSGLLSAGVAMVAVRRRILPDLVDGAGD
jgi:hypothetical protein